MANHILKCPECHSYSLRQDCECGGKRVSPKPAKYSPEDKYGAYRRAAKKAEAKAHAKE
jgi:H/ACA ribonucleoprotein complex subunit 3